MGHIPFKKMNMMTRQNVILKRFEKCPAPICVACTYAKLTRKAWCSKPTKGYLDTQKANEPGDKVLVNELVSPTPGLIAQLTGKLTIKRYKYATVYVDNYSRYGYVHIQKSSSAEETIEGKEIFESHMQSMSVKVKSYITDNRIVRAHKWVEACRRKDQTLSFVGVNVHHQNGYVERRIRELQSTARTNILPAMKR